MRVFPLLTLVSLLSVSAIQAVEWFVSPDGSPSGDGSRERPLDLTAALASSTRIRAGDTVWLRGGTYRGKFDSSLTGSSSSPITVRSYPGEWARIDSGTSSTNRANILNINGSWTIYRDFEVMSSDPVRITSISGSYPKDIKRGEGISVRGANTQLINLIVHDAAQGIAVWSEAPDSEVYGCIIYHNGWQGPDRAHGHGIYSQNEIGYKLFRDNIIFNQFNKGIQVYGSDAAELRNFRIEGNSIFNNGILSRTRELEDNITIYGGSTGPQGIVVLDNLCYGNGFEGKLMIGGEGAKDLIFQRNYVPHLSRIRYWQSANVTGNTFLRTSTLLELYTTKDPGSLPYVWNQNVYFGPDMPFATYHLLSDGTTRGQGLSFDRWRQVTGFDSSSQYRFGRPAGTKVTVRRNQYEGGRGTVTVYNWDRASTARVDLGSVLVSGQSFEIRSAQNYFAAPVLTGVFDGASVTLPTANLRAAAPIGISAPPETGPEFNVFVVRATGVAAPANTPPAISSIPSQNTTADTTTAPIAFMVADAETPAEKLAVLSSSSNPTLVPANNITVGGIGANRWVTIKPASGQSGTLTITLAVTDGSLVRSTSFSLTVTPLAETPTTPPSDLVNDYPTMTSIPDQNATAGVRAGPLTFTIRDPETPGSELIVRAVTSDETLIPSNNIVLGGSGSERMLTVTPIRSGTAKVTLIVSDGSKTIDDGVRFYIQNYTQNPAQPPSISSIANQVIAEDTSTAALAFTIGDPDTAVSSLSLRGTSSNPTLIPDANIRLSGSDANRAVVVIPAPDQYGVANVTISVSDGVLSAQRTFSVTVESLPEPITSLAPTGLTATTGDTRITLKWNSSSGAASYHVKRSKINGGPYSVISTASSADYTDTGLVNGRMYYYVVSAVYSGTESPNSLQVAAAPGTSSTVTPPAAPSPVPPAAPSGLSAKAVSSSQINLAWTDASSDETGFSIERKTGSSGTYSQIGLMGAGTTTYSNSGLAANTQFFYRVRATNQNGNSAYSNEASATTASLPVNSTAQPNLTATAGATRITLNWTAIGGASSYNVKRSKISGGPYSTIANVSSPYYTDTGLVTGRVYYYVVSTNTSSGESDNSNQVQATPN